MRVVSSFALRMRREWRVVCRAERVREWSPTSLCEVGELW